MLLKANVSPLPKKCHLKDSLAFPFATSTLYLDTWKFLIQQAWATWSSPTRHHYLMWRLHISTQWGCLSVMLTFASLHLLIFFHISGKHRWKVIKLRNNWPEDICTLLLLLIHSIYWASVSISQLVCQNIFPYIAFWKRLPPNSNVAKAEAWMGWLYRETKSGNSSFFSSLPFFHPSFPTQTMGHLPRAHESGRHYALSTTYPRVFLSPTLH